MGKRHREVAPVLSVDELELSVRASNLLYNAGIATVDHLCAMPRAEVAALLGSRFVEVEDEVRRIGRALEDQGADEHSAERARLVAIALRAERLLLTAVTALAEAQKLLAGARKAGG